MNIKLDRNDVALTKATISDKHRPMLESLCVRDGKIIALDGYLLVMRDAVGDKQDEEVLLPAKIINSLKVNTKRHAEIEAEDNIIEVGFVDKKGEVLADEFPATYRTHDLGTFPVVNSLFQNTETKGEIALSVGLLKRLLSCLPDKGALRLRISETKDPVEFSCDAGDRPIQGLVMPMYVDWNDFKWYSDTIK